MSAGPWCQHHFPIEAVELWLKETGEAVLRHESCCGICRKPKLRLLPQDHSEYMIEAGGAWDFNMGAWRDMDNVDQWIGALLRSPDVAAHILAQPFRCVTFAHFDITSAVRCEVMELYQDFETALAISRSRKRLFVYQLPGMEKITVA